MNVMPQLDREWVKAIVEKAMGELAQELPRNCPIIKKVKIAAVAFLLGVAVVGGVSPHVGKIIQSIIGV